MSTLELRPLEPAHAETLLRWMLDPGVAENVGLRSTPTLARTLDWMGKASVDARAIFHEGQHIGNVVLDRLDTHLQTARISIYLGEPSARGKGLAAEAMRLALARGFAQHGLHRIWLTVHERNAPALALYARVGFIREGVMRGDFLLRGERVNAILMSILRSEFTAAPQP
jgi:RimJ/RimL family protein N-acetyltransferase